MSPEQNTPRNEGPDSRRTEIRNNAPDNRRHEEDEFMDTDSDRERLKSEVAYIELPDISDIPGQEHIHTAPMGELADTTISSDDEEGIINDDSDDDNYFSATGSDEDDTAGIP